MELMEKWAHQGSMVKPENQAAKEKQVWKTMQRQWIVNKITSRLS